jgi:hypothetical protein
MLRVLDGKTVLLEQSDERPEPLGAADARDPGGERAQSLG